MDERDKEFIEAIERNNRFMDAVVRRLDAGTRELMRNRVDTSELLEESRAQREALFKILDRLDGGGAAPA